MVCSLTPDMDLVNTLHFILIYVVALLLYCVLDLINIKTFDKYTDEGKPAWTRLCLFHMKICLQSLVSVNMKLSKGVSEKCCTEADLMQV